MTAISSEMLDKTALVQQVTVTQTAMGGASRSYATRIASLDCGLSRRTIGEVDAYGKRTYREGYRLYCNASTAALAIETTDRIVVDGNTYEVTGIYNPGGTHGHVELDMERID